ncbi:MAG: cytochrome c oxidase subunit 3 [Salinisphaeraceae bacterium]|nr:cytochrome c oxidase subunit 3 [Salinisphaeraceae bacterium]
MASEATLNTKDQKYFVPEPSAWPFMMTISMFVFMIGFASWLNDAEIGKYIFGIGLVMILAMSFIWFRGVVNESLGGSYRVWEDKTFRWSMSWFIFSEVMFFAAFFGALYYARVLSVPWLSGEGSEFSTNEYLWKGFEAAWPTNGPESVGGEFQTIPAWGVPFLNTIILVVSGITFEIAHHMLKEGKRGVCLAFMGLTVALGCLFLFFQAEEYILAYQQLNLTLGSGIYGSTFFMLTGFHGAHVTLGTLMLAIITLRIAKGHFKPTDDSHFAFESVGWYWHFVDVVWIGLFVFVYVV